MFNIENFPEILMHLKSSSQIFKRNNRGWYEMFCPYCDDAVRKFSPKHGHFNISPNDPFAHCFRCGGIVGLYKLLIDTNFQNVELITYIQKISNITYSKTGTSKFNKIGQEKDKIINVKTKIIQQYEWLNNNHPDLFEHFKNYIYSRCLDINPIKFLMVPSLFYNNLQLKFLNYSGDIITTRNINSSSSKYIIDKGSKKYYYFQDVFDIDMYKNIIITEGAIDLVNLYNYYYPFKNSFFISIGGNNYNGAVIDIINSYLLIGRYSINIVFDYDILKRVKKITNIILRNANKLNPEIDINFYYPLNSKDVSEIMLLDQIGGF